MNIEYQDFIGVYQDVYPEGYCQHLIDRFDDSEKNRVGFDRWQSEKSYSINKNDYQINMSSIGYLEFEGISSRSIFFEGLQKCYNNYLLKFSSLQNNKINACVMKGQRTPPGGGYHVWHGEQGNNESSSRCLVYMLYLNTLELNEGGETEFLYQRQRYRPKENTLLIWPAAFTHTHRGNTVLGDKSKYVITGWFYFD